MTSSSASGTVASSSALMSSLLALGKEAPKVQSASWSKLRRSALDALLNQGLPGRKTEAFRFSPIGNVTGEALQAGVDLAGTAVDGLVPGAVLLTIVNGSIRLPANLPAGLRVVSLRQALEQGDSDASIVGSLVAEQDGWVAANTSGFVDGYLVVVDDGVKLSQTIEFACLQGGTASEPKAVVSLPRVVVVLGKGAEAELVERHISLGDQVSLANAVIEVALGVGAALSHSRWVDVGENAYHLVATAVTLAENASYHAWSLAAAGRYVRHDLQVYLRGAGATANLDGLYYGRPSQLVDNHVRVWHEQPHGTTRECYRGVIENQGRGVFDGIIYVLPGAMKTDARQENRNLLLGPDAVINTKPHLEIDADDVSCAHGATVGQLDEAQLFYLRARGIDEELGRQLLTWAFAKEIVERCPVAAVAKAATARLRGALPAGVDAEGVA